MEQTAEMPEDVGIGMGKEDAGGRFTGKVPGDGLYGGCEGGQLRSWILI